MGFLYSLGRICLFGLLWTWLNLHNFQPDSNLWCLRASQRVYLWRTCGSQFLHVLLDSFWLRLIKKIESLQEPLGYALQRQFQPQPRWSYAANHPCKIPLRVHEEPQPTPNHFQRSFRKTWTRKSIKYSGVNVEMAGQLCRKTVDKENQRFDRNDFKTRLIDFENMVRPPGLEAFLLLKMAAKFNEFESSLIRYY